MLDARSHADDLTHMCPFGEIPAGWKKIRTDYEQLANTGSRDRVQVDDPHLVAAGHLAFQVGYQLVTTVRNGQPANVKICTTDVFNLENGRWKVRAHHTDQLVSG